MVNVGEVNIKTIQDYEDEIVAYIGTCEVYPTFEELVKTFVGLDPFKLGLVVRAIHNLRSKGVTVYDESNNS